MPKKRTFTESNNEEQTDEGSECKLIQESLFIHVVLFIIVCNFDNLISYVLWALETAVVAK